MTRAQNPVLTTLPAGWRNLWRAHTALPAAAASQDFTIYVRALDLDAAHVAVQDALRAMFRVPDADLEHCYYNLSCARDLVDEGVSDDEGARLFEVGWQGTRVTAWVSNPVFVVPDAHRLFEVWAALPEADTTA